MGIVSLIFGIIALIISLVSFIPYLAWLNYITIPVAVIGFIFGAIGLGIGITKGTSVTGLIFNIAAFVLGVWRL